MIIVSEVEVLGFGYITRVMFELMGNNSGMNFNSKYLVSQSWVCHDNHGGGREYKQWESIFNCSKHIREVENVSNGKVSLNIGASPEMNSLERN